MTENNLHLCFPTEKNLPICGEPISLFKECLWTRDSIYTQSSLWSHSSWVKTHGWHFTCLVFHACVPVPLVFTPIDLESLHISFWFLIWDYLSCISHIAIMHFEHSFISNRFHRYIDLQSYSSMSHLWFFHFFFLLLLSVVSFSELIRFPDVMTAEFETIAYQIPKVSFALVSIICRLLSILLVKRAICFTMIVFVRLLGLNIPTKMESR